MYQDEAGRWVSDNGRYLWDGTEWVDLQATGDVGADGPPQPTVSPADGVGRRSRRPLLLFAGLIVLVAAGVAAVLVAGRRSGTAPSTNSPPPALSGPAAAPPPSSTPFPTALSQPDRRDRADAALLHRADVVGTTEEQLSNPTDVFLPCRAPALTPPAGTVLAGQTVSNSDFTTYAGQTVAGFPTVRQAGEALAAIRRTVARCAPYDFKYVNSSRADHITFPGTDPALKIDDGGVYLTEVDMPANYAGSPTSYGYGYVQRGQFLVRLTVTIGGKADRPEVERLLRLSLDRLG